MKDGDFRSTKVLAYVRRRNKITDCRLLTRPALNRESEE